MQRGRRVGGGILAGLALSLLGIAPIGQAAADQSPVFIPKDAPWLTTVNYYREMAGLTPVTEDATLSDGAYKHSCYMLQNDISHDEVVGNPGYTPEGQAAGTHGNVAVSSVYNERARSHIELWMTGPFHAVGVLRPNLQRVGFGKCDMSTTLRWHSGATLDVLHGLGPTKTLTQPILFPGNGTTTNLNRFVVESPDPLPFCGWTGSAGLPILALMPEAPSGAVTASVTGPSGALETCALTAQNTTGVAQAILSGNNVVVAIPRAPLTAGSYSVTITTAARTVQWSFTVDPTAANPPPATTPATPSATPSGTAVGFQPVTPVRLVDTREGVGATTLVGQVSKRIQITGTGAIPPGASALSANFTVTNTSGGGYLTAWNCAAERPVVASLNFGAGETVPNGVTVPLDATGGLCVYSPVGADLIIDANGYYALTGQGRFRAIDPVRLMDTRSGLGGSGRLSGGQTAALQVGGANGIPLDAKAVSLNVASVDPSEVGFVTVYPCDQQRPLAASLNPQPGKVRPNLVVTPIAADGTVCFYTLHDVDLVVDAAGYLSTSATSGFTATVPFRFTDTRDGRADVNAGTGGSPLGGGQLLQIQVAGQRGVPAGTKAISINIAVTSAVDSGFITAWPCGPRPNTASVNYEAGNPISNGATVPLSDTGQLCVFTYSTAHVIIDVNGWWA